MNQSNTGIYRSDGDNLIIGSSEIGISTNAAELMDLYIQGKSIIKDKDEYLDIIMRLPYVQGDNLKAVEVFERWKRTQNFLNKSEEEENE